MARNLTQRKVEDPKVCRKCGVPKPRTEYYRVKSTARGVHSYCKPCHKSYDVVRRRANPERARQIIKTNELKRKYGLTWDDFDRLLEAQDGCCAICGTKTPNGQGGRFHVDHCHSTGAVRGLLCNNCNVGLGNFKDDLNRLEKAIAYLRKGCG